MRNAIRQLRKQAVLRQEGLANLLGVSRQTIIAIENDKYTSTLQPAMKLARFFKRNAEKLFFGKD